MRPDRDAILRALENVVDPELRRPVTELDMVRDVLVSDDGSVSVTIALTVAGCPLRDSFSEQVTRHVGAVPGVTGVRLGFDVMSPEEKQALVARLRGGHTADRTISLSPATRVLAVASGKGGVGKSTLTANLAFALSALGEQVGVLDGDIYGHSIPHMLGVHQKPIAVDSMIVPPVRGDLKLMSIGFFLEENAPVMWRGPMLHKALEQFLSDVHWGDLDTLLVDMPPGTGDVAMSLGQLLPRAEALVVTTPQPAAQQVAVRAAQMARKTGMRLAGAVENMSYLAGTGQELFGSGGGQALADEMDVPLLARIPLDPLLREAADEGSPVAELSPESEAAVAIAALAESVAATRAGTIRTPLTVPRRVGACPAPRSSTSTARSSRARARSRSPGRSASGG
jgi:ATP-binding protein involved in chromosome partitioning